MKKFRDLDFPKDFEFSADSEGRYVPFYFYNQVFPISNKVDLFLGYFNSYTFSILSESFAEFIYNGGEIRIITNHYYASTDYDNLFNSEIIENTKQIEDVLNDLKELQKTLDKRGQLFFDCLKYLKEKGRLQIQPVFFRRQNMNHHKKMVFYRDDEAILTQGSMNFTPAGVSKNGESFQVEVPWNGEVSRYRIEEQQKKFEKIFNKKHSAYTYIAKEKLERVIDDIGNNKELKDLLVETIDLEEDDEYSEKIKRLKKEREEKFKILIKSIENTPKFPFEEPFPYQVEAYQKWNNSGQQGLFAMATGTGKTITALNCVLEEYKKENYYKVLILVPTKILVSQWTEECKKFNFKNIFSIYSRGWRNSVKSIQNNEKLGQRSNFIFISTYATFNTSGFQALFNRKDSETILIADEVHTLGTKRSLSNLLNGITKRIGLSATPNRKYDESGSSEIARYFNSAPPCYTISFPMTKAIEDKYLTPYIYNPRFVSLELEEMEAYSKISEKLLKHYDFKKNKYKESAKNLLIQRKNIINQASNKKELLNRILSEIKEQDAKPQHTLVYSPTGFEDNYEEKDEAEVKEDDNRLINQYTKIVRSHGLAVHQITGTTENREKILKQFENGLIQVLTAMNVLDEGVDIPATKYAIFCSSSGNPRQYIQRRGRILRKFEGKKKAMVYDMIIAPNESGYWMKFPKSKRESLMKMEKNIFRNELFRVANFLYASKSSELIHTKEDESINRLLDLAEEYNINFYELINQLNEQDKICE